MTSRNPGHGISRRNTEPSINTYLFGGGHTTKEERLAYIDREIMRTEDGIVKLVLQRAFLKRQRNSLIPAVNLPNELLALIFELACLPTCTEFDGGHDSGVNHSPGGQNLGLSVGMGAVTPVFLGSICSRWRHVSQGASQLWTTLTVHVNNRCAEDQASLLQSWLIRSAMRPLSLSVIEDVSNDQDNDENWGIEVAPDCIIDVLTTHSHQWHTIDFFLPSSWNHLLSRVKHKIPMLRKATLRVAESSPSIARISAFAQAPQLQDVRLVGYSTANVILPYAQLRSLHEEYFGLQECLDALHLCGDLRMCQFEQLYGGTQPFLVRPIQHHLLESLEILLDDTHNLTALFGALTVPNLTELILSIPDNASLLQPVIPLIQRSRCKLRRVHLVGDMPREDELISFLREVPMLKALLLINPTTETGGKVTQRLLDLLNPDVMSSRSSRRQTEDQGGVQPGESEKETCLVPFLETLEYQGATGFTPHQFAEFLVSRWRLGSQCAVKPLETGKLPGTPPRIDDLSVPSTPSAGLPPAVTDSLATFSDLSSSKRGRDIPPSFKGAQLRSVVFTTTKKIKFDCEDAKIVLDLMREGMHLEFLDDPNAD